MASGFVWREKKKEVREGGRERQKKGGEAGGERKVEGRRKNVIKLNNFGNDGCF